MQTDRPELPARPRGAAPRGPRLAETPRLDALLARLRGELSRLVWLHAIGTVVGAVAVWLLFAFFADVALAVPKAVRWLHLTLLFALPAVLLWRELLRHLPRRPGDEGLAVLVERAHPESQERLVSAVQLARTPATDPSAPLVRALLADAEELASRLDGRDVLDPKPPRTRLLAGLGAALAASLVFVTLPGYSSIFFQRLFGSDVPWPQRTTLALEIPVGDQHAVGPEELAVRVARGTDVPVLVRAAGEVPEAVTLHFEGGQAVLLSRSGGDVFRTLLRSCQEDTTFWVTGGDDRDGLPRVRLEVLQPPDVAGLAVEIEPPAYAGLAPRLVFDRDVEVLAGSRVRVRILPEPRDATGRVRLLPADRTIDLEPAPWPVAELAAAAAAAADGVPAPVEDGGDAAAETALGFELVVEETLRYQFELQDASGLPNPDPGLFAIHVAPDRAPDVEVLAPGRGDVDTVKGGALPLRVRAEDDFGITRLAWTAGPVADDAAPSAEGELAPTAIEPRRPAHPGDDARGTGAERAGRVAVLGATRLDVASIAGEGDAVEGQQLVLSITAEDNRAPAPQIGRSAAVRVRVVSTEEFMRRVQDRLARTRLMASSLGELQREKRARTRELLASLQSDTPAEGGEAADVAAALTGQRRVQGDADALARELAAIVETVLYARVDERAGPLLDALDRALAAETERGWRAAPWLQLTAGYREGRLGAAGLSGKLVEILGVGLAIGEQHSRAAVAALSQATDHAADARLDAMAEALMRAGDAQAAAQQSIEALLELLSEWDNFQSILTLTRDILNRQENLSERTRQFAKDP